MRTARLARAFVGAALTLVLATAAAAQPERVDGRPFLIDDTLLTGVALSATQRADVAELRKLQFAEQEGARAEFLDAVEVMRRARERGDDDTAAAIMSMMQSDMRSQQTWRLAALRALLTPEQRRTFDANVDALTAAERSAAGAPPA